MPATDAERVDVPHIPIVRGYCAPSTNERGPLLGHIRQYADNHIGNHQAIRQKSDDMQASIVDDDRNGVDSGDSAHDKQGGGGTAEGKGACFIGWQRAGT